MQDENKVVNLTSHVLFHVMFCTCSDFKYKSNFWSKSSDINNYASNKKFLDSL